VYEAVMDLAMATPLSWGGYMTIMIMCYGISLECDREYLLSVCVCVHS